MARKKYYMVGIVKNFIEVTMHVDHPMQLVARGVCQCVWAEGQVGAFPLFKDMDSAIKYCGQENADKIREYEVEVPENA